MVEYCNSIKSIKYINEGSDQAASAIEKENDEVLIYQTARYTSSSEAVSRILAFPIHERVLPGERSTSLFHRGNIMDKVDDGFF